MQNPVAWPVCALLAALVGGAVLASAWLCDDALVTLRHVENLVAGDGFRWNVLDRAQTAAHPLWILLLAAVHALRGGELYFTTIGVGVALTTVAVFTLTRRAGSVAAAVGVVGVAALGSRAFVEFGTGGLENPLVYALLALYLRDWIALAGSRRLRRLVLTGALLGLARQDVGLLILPSTLAAMAGLGMRAILRAIWPGAAIVGAWCAFALVYFGTIVPTPAFGKVVAADVERTELIAQGLRYFGYSLLHDPVTIAVIAAAIVAGCFRPAVAKSTLALGVLLQVLYVVAVGGDFMAGRFFTAAFVVAVFTLARALPGRAAWLAAALLAIAAVLPGLPPWARGTPTQADYRIDHGIGNERAYYAAMLGLWSPTRIVPRHGLHGALFAGRSRPAVVLMTTAGAGLVAGPNVHVVEPYLCDPLLARLPLEDPHDWRIGHFKRRIPEGYLETLATGSNRIRDAALAEYWDALEVVLRAPLFAAERWRVLWRFWTGGYDPLLARYIASGYMPPPRIELSLAELAATAGASIGTLWYDADCVVVREGGVRLRRGDVAAARPVGTVRLLIDGGGAGTLTFRRGGEVLGEVELAVTAGFPGGARWFPFAVPAAAREFDAIDLTLRCAEPGIEPKLYTLPVLALLGVELSE
ncbi:MAG: hypothetical protein KDE27_19870 [Planctomycetes bacterium]|nr:hypothetical protein [Planctomycetota bacterium]